MSVVDKNKSVLNVRVSPESRANLEEAAKRFKLGIADLVDRVLARPEAIATAVMGAFEAIAATSPAKRVVRGPQLPLPIKKGARRGRAK